MARKKAEVLEKEEIIANESNENAVSNEDEAKAEAVENLKEKKGRVKNSGKKSIDSFRAWWICCYVYNYAFNKTQDQARKIYAWNSCYNNIAGGSHIRSLLATLLK